MSAVARGQQKIGNANKSRAPFADSGLIRRGFPGARAGAVLPQCILLCICKQSLNFLEIHVNHLLLPKATSKKGKQKFDENVDIGDMMIMIYINGF